MTRVKWAWLAAALMATLNLNFSFSAWAEEASPAAPTAEAETLPGSAVPVSEDVMADVFTRFGAKAPTAPKEGSKGAAGTETAKKEEESDAIAKAKETPAAGAGEEPEDLAALQNTATSLEAAAKELEAKVLAEPENAAVKEAAEEARAAATAAAEKVQAQEDAEAGITTLELTPEQDTYLQQEVASQVETATQELTARLAAAEAARAELETKVQTLGARPAAMPQGIHPLFMTDNPAEIAQRKQDLGTFKRWCQKNWDGYEAASEKEKSFTKEEIREAFGNVEQELTEVLPAVEQRFAMRARIDPVAKELFPALFDARSNEHKLMQQFLQSCPNIRLIPNYKILIGDALAGEAMRLAKAKAQGAAGRGTKAEVVKGKTIIRVAVKRAPAVPVGSHPGRNGPLSQAPRRAKGAADVKGFVKAGATHAALVDVVSQFLPG